MLEARGFNRELSNFVQSWELPDRVIRDKKSCNPLPLVGLLDIDKASSKEHCAPF